MIEMFHNVPRETILLSHYDFYHLVELVRAEIKDFYYPWEYPDKSKVHWLSYSCKILII